MALKLTVLSDQRAPLGPRGSIVFGVGGGSIGRAHDNDWVLPDPQRYLSAHHARVRFTNGAFHLLDTSTNGVFINERTTALGRRGSYSLRDGDRLRLGEYVIAVSIDDAAAETAQTVTPIAANGAAANETLDMEGDLGELLQLTPSPAGLMGAVEALLQPGPERELPASRPERRTGARDDAAGTGIEAFCRGAGIDRTAFSGEAQARALQLAGSLLREALVGLKALVIAQREVRAGHQIEVEREEAQRIGLTGLPVEDLLQQLLQGHDAHELDAVQWLRDTLAGIRRHDVALVRAQRAALAQFLERLDPEMLAHNGLVQPGAGGKTDIGVLVERFRGIANMPPGRLPHLYAEAFAREFAEEFKLDQDT
ncbi:MAG: FHA domain-containing protein [Steroidobacteraceae bacterium]|jgi:predicted component of type VI protein secretion system